MRGIAITGKAGSGKTALAGAILNEFAERGGVPARRFAFGDALKREVFDTYGVTKTDPTGRALLVYHGERKRNADPLYWIRALAAKLEDECNYFPVVDDLRFPTELAWCIGRGFVVVRLEAPRLVRLCRLRANQADETIVDATEPGETGLDLSRDDFDYVFRNCDEANVEQIATTVLREVAPGLSARSV